jgi:hypothetical protein
MTDGIGVGLQSDGNGNWNLVTLSGTTVTVGASSGLTDGKTARIEIEKDITGAYWYYIYDAAGTKLTTATGKLFTALSEGYTGWYANGNSKTYAIENISIRAESIVGRTNVEVTEPFWFRDEFGENSLGRYIQPSGKKFTYDTDHVIYTGTLRGALTLPVWMKFPVLETTFSLTGTDTHNRVPIVVCQQTSGNEVILSVNQTGYVIYYLKSANVLRIYKQSNIIASSSLDLSLNTQYNVRVTVTDDTIDNIKVFIAPVGSSYPEIPTLKATDLTYLQGYCGVRSYGEDEGYEIRYYRLQISGTRVYQKPIHRGAMLGLYSTS